MITIKEGTFQILRPIYSQRIQGWLIGGVVGASKGMAYTKRLRHSPTIHADIARETEKIRMKIHQDHPGIVEEKLKFGQAERVGK